LIYIYVFLIRIVHVVYNKNKKNKTKDYATLYTLISKSTVGLVIWPYKSSPKWPIMCWMGC